MTDEEDGGFLATFPDLPGCMVDGGARGKAIAEARDAIESSMEARREWERVYPKAKTSGMSGKFVQRLPKSLHAKLAAQATREGVRLNGLVLALLAKGIGKRQAQGRTRQASK